MDPSPVSRYETADKVSVSIVGLVAAAVMVFHPAERTRGQEWRQCALAEVEAKAKREVGENCEEVK